MIDIQCANLKSFRMETYFNNVGPARFGRVEIEQIIMIMKSRKVAHINSILRYVKVIYTDKEP